MQKTVFEHIRAHLLDIPIDEQNQATLEELEQTEWCTDFERKMRNRLILGSLRYGRMGCAGKPQYNRVKDMHKRLDKYLEDGNLEHLVDISNLAMLEYVEGEHPKRHFKSQDDGEHTKEGRGK